MNEPLLEEREFGVFYVGPLAPAQAYVRANYTIREYVGVGGAYTVEEHGHSKSDEPVDLSDATLNSWGTSASGDVEEAWRYFLGTDFGPMDEEYDEEHLRALLAQYDDDEQPADNPVEKLSDSYDERFHIERFVSGGQLGTGWDRWETHVRLTEPEADKAEELLTAVREAFPQYRLRLAVHRKQTIETREVLDV